MPSGSHSGPVRAHSYTLGKHNAGLSARVLSNFASKSDWALCSSEIFESHPGKGTSGTLRHDAAE